MKIFRWIKEFFQFFWEDTKTDFQAIYKMTKRVKEGKPAIPDEKVDWLKSEVKKLTFKDVLSVGWGIWLMMALAFTVGWWLASQYYEVQCNNVIWEEYMEPQKKGLWHAVPGSRPDQVFGNITFPSVKPSSGT